jgi:acyl transferase domain-containing protein/NAD(P)H-dependent flavin oxidoreductase YrpB (nitropropane dioxygenase family)
LLDFIVLSPAASIDASLAIGGSRAGAIGVVDLEFATDRDVAISHLTRASELGGSRLGVQVADEDLLGSVLARGLRGLRTIMVAASAGDRMARLIELAHAAHLDAFVVAIDLPHAQAAQTTGADAVIAKGHEAGGWVGEEGSFVLLQRLLAEMRLPVWVQGGIGLRTIAAAHAAGAAGVILDAQLLLAHEAAVPEHVRLAVSSMDGSETTTVGSALATQFRVYTRPGLEPLEQLRAAENELAAGGEANGEHSVDDAGALQAWRSTVRQNVALGVRSDALGTLPLGQDAAFAADLGRRFRTVAGILAGFREALSVACAALESGNPLAEGAPLAKSHGTRYPIVQGPMTRVSDRAEFAAAVAHGGALPFLALALMRAPEADELLARTAQLVGKRPWGVGILGFVPQELRAEQLGVVRAHRPPFALIAGGRPDQALELEREGIATYLHVPSPGLLKLYLADGARRFVFEGRECGGHVGPRTSFVLWDTMLRVLLEELPGAGSDCHVLFAGGIHDARSAAMVAAMAAPAAERRIRVGALMGTGYLFTSEATSGGAITARFQQAAVAAQETVLLESGPGHATRCLPSPFVEQFAAEKCRLGREGLSSAELRGSLEQLNIGRLRIAAKGADRNPRFDVDPSAPKLAELEPAEQWERGMYMIGQVAALRSEVGTIADLHRDVAEGSSEQLSAIEAPEVAQAFPPPPAPPPPADIAIIGLGCILPGAPDVRTFWANILGKVDAIGEVPAERWDWRLLYDDDPSARDKVYSRWGGFIDPVAFEPVALGLPPKSLASIEPFQLLALLSSQAALDDAGYATRPFNRARTSVILGAGGGGADLAVGYTVRSALPPLLGDSAGNVPEHLLERLPEWTEDSFAGMLMNVAAGRIANRLDFGGTNYTVDAACASSLSAIALGSRELQSGTSDLVLAGGIDAIQNPFAFLCFAKTHALSPRGRCRPFDASADGIAISEGFGTLVLKRLADAERDGDRIYAVIRGVGAASDGRDRSLTAPRPEGQMRALRRAYAQARFSPATVELVEAHGTGTVAGDGAEVKALSTVFGEHSSSRQWCAIGSVKSMIGHTKATAGVAGMVKAALALHHRVLPPTIGVTEPNPKADFPASPFYVNSEARPWLNGGGQHPRRAAVSAFGFGGTDFHIVLEEYTGSYLPPQEAVIDRWPAELLLWRGSRAEIQAAVEALAAKLDAGAKPPLADLAKTLSVEAGHPGGAGTDNGATLALVVESLEDLRAKLTEARRLLESAAIRAHTPHGLHFSAEPLGAQGRVAFLFPGQGSQVADMARELALAFPEAREPFERADALLADRYEQPLSRYIFPPPTFTEEERRQRQAELTDTHVAQAALGATELAYLRVLASLGIEPEMTAGHSYGEFVALAAGGGLDDDQLLELSEVRGRLMREAAAGEAGAMAAVDAAPDALGPILADGAVVMANLNSPRQTVLSGPTDRIDAAVDWCRTNGLRARRLPVACAFHSPHVAGARERFAELLERPRLSVPEVPVYSNTTGEAHVSDEAAIGRVLAEHLVKPVEFVREIETMYDDGARIFLEVGPRAVLTALVEQILGERAYLVVPIDRPGRSGLVQLLHCLAGAVSEGVPIRTERLFRGRRAQHIDLKRLGSEDGAAAHPRGAWLVNGGHTWPADAPAEAVPTTSSIPHQETPRVTTTITNGSGALVPLHPSEEASAPSRPEASTPQATPTAPLAPGPPPSGAPAPDVTGALPHDRTAGVMTRYQLLMQQFLETQRDVMLTYLGSAPQAPRDRVAPPAVRALPAPPSSAVPAASPAQSGAAPDSPVPVPDAAARAAVPAQPAPAGGPPATAGTVSANGQAALTAQDIHDQLLEIVSERTGYPQELLGLDADLEGDLGVDSIKRVEIAGTFTQGLALEARAAIDVERVTASRTLRDVIAALQGALGSGPPDVLGEASPPPLSLPESSSFEAGPVVEERIGRFVVYPASAPAITTTGRLANRGAVVVVDDETGVGEGIVAALADQGETVVRLAASSAPDDAEGAAELTQSVRSEYGRCKALVHLAALADGAPEYGGIAALLALVQAMREDLAAAAADGGAAVLAATRLGGTFGAGQPASDAPAAHRAIAGFLKTLAIEWPSVRVKAVDVDDSPAERHSAHLLAEMAAADELTEVGYRDGQRIQLTLRPEPLSGRQDEAPIDGDSVLLITGGARGITAQVALAIAERHRPTLVLVGRTAPQDEAPETASATDTASLRRTLIEARRSAGEDLTPALVERDCRRIMRSREVRENVQRMENAGARVEYLTCDVGDSSQFAALIDDVYARHGRIDGVVHGAGRIEDRLVRDKRRDSLERVLATKAGAAQMLADRLRPEQLRFLVLFSSVSGRFGNRGQADYAAASEVLGCLAHQLDARWPGRVVAIDWGPWRAEGMVSPELEREFARRGVGLIPPDRGCELLIEELRRGAKGEAEIVIGAATGLSAERAGIAPAGYPLLSGRPQMTAAGELELLRSLTLDHDWYLDSHRVDGRPVLPFAVAMELMAELAVLASPSRQLSGLRGIRLLKGVTVPDHRATRVAIRVTPYPSGAQFDATIGAPEGRRPQYRAIVDLRDADASPLTEAAAPPPLASPAPYSISVEDAYRDLLFHGPLFQGITALNAIDDGGSSADLRPSDPGRCVAEATGRVWLLDPVLLDSALQAQVVWARLQWDLTLLPAEIDSYTRFAAPEQGEPVRHELRVRAESAPPFCRADHWFYGSDGRLLATLRDVVGVGTSALNRLAEAQA